MTVTPSPQSVGPSGPKRVLVLKSAVERLILAADMYGVAHLDSDDMDDDAVELQDATEGMKDALAAAPAPAPSSLAGGKAMKSLRFIANMERNTDRLGSVMVANWIIQDLAALSPEAPARDGVEKALHLKLIDTLKPFAEVAEKLKHCHVVEICEPTPDNPSRNIIPMPREWFERAADDLEVIAIQLHSDGVLSEGQTAKLTGLDRVEVRKQVDALTPREEAPATLCDHGHADPMSLCSDCEAVSIEAPAEALDVTFEAWLNERNLLPHGAWDWPSIIAMLNHHEDALAAPEAREEALGNLLAVIHGDGGHRALEVGTKQAALEAEKIVAGLLAAPSADKLRDHLEWIETVLTDPVPGYTARIATAREYIDQALAALTPRHEAQADHHERNLTASNAELIEQALSRPPLEAPAEGAGEPWDYAVRYLPGDAEDYGLLSGYPADLAKTLHTNPLYEVLPLYLRARSSAPEAREGEAVEWRWRIEGVDGWRRCGAAKPHFAASQPGNVVDLQALYTHPAAPSADKLRIAVEALLTLPELKKRQEHLSKGIGTATDEGKIVLQVLAALKAEV